MTTARLQRYADTIATNDAIRRLKRAGCSTEDIMQRLSVSPTRVAKTSMHHGPSFAITNDPLRHTGLRKCKSCGVILLKESQCCT